MDPVLKAWININIINGSKWTLIIRLILWKGIRIKIKNKCISKENNFSLILLLFVS